MAKLQRDDAKHLWEMMGDKPGWGPLIKALQQHLDKVKGIENRTVKTLLCEAEHYQGSKEAFPESASKMASFLNDHMADFKDCAEDQAKQQQGKAQKEQQHQASKKHPRAESHQQPAAHQQPERSHASAGEKQPAAKDRVQREMKHQVEANQGEANRQGEKQKTAQKPTAQETGQKRAIRLSIYQPEDLAVLYKRGNWKSWDEMIHFLQQMPPTEDAFTEDMVQEMIRDLQELKARDVPFNPNHNQVFELLRGQNR